MKGSARAGSVIATPVNAEERSLKVCASVADKKYLCCNFITVLRGIGQGFRANIILNTKIKALYAAVCG
jgi:hypothetical protein